MRMLALLLLAGLVLAAPPARAQAPESAPPESVQWKSLPGAALYWTQLPAIQFDEAILRTSDGRGVQMAVHERIGNFAIVRLRDSTGEGWATYVGPQKFNQDGAAGRRMIVSVEGLQRLPAPPEATGVFAGVSPTDLSTRLTLVFDDGRRMTVERRIGGVGEADVVINGAPVTLDAFIVEIKTQFASQAEPVVAQAVYAPALGAAVRGVFVEPRRIEWRLEGIQAPPDVFARLRNARAR